MATEESIYDHYLILGHGRTKSSRTITVPEGYRFIFFSHSGETVLASKISSFIRLVNQMDGQKKLNYLAREDTCQAQYQSHNCPDDGDNKPDETYINYRNPDEFPAEHFTPGFISDLRHFVNGDVIPDLELSFFPYFNLIDETTPHGLIYRMGVIPLIPGRIDFPSELSYQGKGYTLFPSSAEHKGKKIIDWAFEGNTAALEGIFAEKASSGEESYRWTTPHTMFSTREKANVRKVTLLDLLKYLPKGTYFMGACRSYSHPWSYTSGEYNLSGKMIYEELNPKIRLTHVNNIPLAEFQKSNPEFDSSKLLAEAAASPSLERQTSENKLTPPSLALLRETSEDARKHHTSDATTGTYGPELPPGSWRCGKCGNEMLPDKKKHIHVARDTKGGFQDNNKNKSTRFTIKYPNL